MEDIVQSSVESGAAVFTTNYRQSDEMRNKCVEKCHSSDIPVWSEKPDTAVARRAVFRQKQDHIMLTPSDRRKRTNPHWLMMSDSIGSPSYPSPLDRIRSGKRERAAQLGLSLSIEEPYEANQSLPAMRKLGSSPCVEFDPGAGDTKLALRRFKGDALNSFCFSPPPCKTSLHASLERQRSTCIRSFGHSWDFFEFVGGTKATGSVPSHIRNPNKAVVTLNGRTSEILIANEMACELFGYYKDELIGMPLSDHFKCKQKHEALMENHLESTGEVVMVSGKVLEAVDCNGQVIPVSLWMKMLKTGDDPRCLAIMEPVERITAYIVFDSTGTILCADQKMACLHGYTSPSEVEGENIHQLIPSLTMPSSGSSIPKAIRKQRATGRTKHSTTFPLSIALWTDEDLKNPKFASYIKEGSVDSANSRCDRQNSTTSTTSISEKDGANEEFNKEEGKVEVYHATVWVFTNISGMLTFMPDGTIHSINDNFSLMLFGYTQQELVGERITYIIPGFYDDMASLKVNSIPFPPVDDEMELCGRDCHHCPQHDISQPDFSPEVLDVERARSVDAITNTEASHEHASVDLQIKGSTCQLCEQRSSEIGMLDPASGTSANSHSSATMWLSPDSQPSCHSHFPFSNQSSPPSSASRLPTKSQPSPRRQTSPMKWPRTVGKSSCGRHTFSGRRLRQAVACRHAAAAPALQATSTPSKVDANGDRLPPSTLEKPAEGADNVVYEGSCSGQGRHKDGSYIGILYQVKRVEFEQGQSIYCIWVTRDPSDTLAQSNTTGCSSHNNTMDWSKLYGCQEGTTKVDTDVEAVNPGTGRYGELYESIYSIGKGGFGFVQLARRLSDNQMVVTKFITKRKVLSDSWLDDEELGRVPIEISLLNLLSHPNIVQMLEVFENDYFYQVIMEQHGLGMDLFEFIDRRPLLDEPICSYIFQQIVSAVAYLHNLGIIHRDIKDENIILNEEFHCKLIDFGAAAYLKPGKLFNKFFGTIEYCSPEVILGNKYNGPELEMWSLGITLYTLLFGENPFYDVEETIKGILKPPFVVSTGLMQLISWLLHPSVPCRCKMPELQNHEWLSLPINIADYIWEEIVPDAGNVNTDSDDDDADGDDNDEVMAILLQQQLDLCDNDQTEL
ncbi:PREDICTED: PAS domain-containing serine/threonine-protein kinase-like isoform X2 [Priapulus caudatus]|uniref:PAS domain-containing serine/threonine-protein kinase-like isoform X2 n=1 Tax=Priapulus caudatus TaxID=37621 RepID=A0ABM1F8L4_PRICU|nr:PREDICTED: PAS domain-containing serine/threonine-protein kinase-like isoform X2 [Priapulus caudatus]